MNTIMRQSIRSLVCFSLLLLAVAKAREPQWQPAKSPLVTRWAKDISPDTVLNEYPRPQLVRKEWQSLNGLWRFATSEKGQGPAMESILVPFPVESALSGIGKHSDQIQYERKFEVPADWRGRRVLLHFGAVDWH